MDVDNAPIGAEADPNGSFPSKNSGLLKLGQMGGTGDSFVGQKDDDGSTPNAMAASLGHPGLMGLSSAPPYHQGVLDFQGITSPLIGQPLYNVRGAPWLEAPQSVG